MPSRQEFHKQKIYPPSFGLELNVNPHLSIALDLTPFERASSSVKGGFIAYAEA